MSCSVSCRTTPPSDRCSRAASRCRNRSLPTPGSSSPSTSPRRRPPRPTTRPRRSRLLPRPAPDTTKPGRQAAPHGAPSGRPGYAGEDALGAWGCDLTVVPDPVLCAIGDGILVAHPCFLEPGDEERCEQGRSHADVERARGRDRERLRGSRRRSPARTARSGPGTPPGRWRGWPHPGRRRRSQRIEPLRRRPGPRRPPAERPPRRAGVAAPRPWWCAKIVPVIARPTVPPTCWKNVRLLVAVPSRLTGTLFWTISVKTANVGPTPRPVMNIQAHRTGIGVSACRCVSMNRPTAIVASAPNISSR